MASQLERVRSFLDDAERDAFATVCHWRDCHRCACFGLFSGGRLLRDVRDTRRLVREEVFGPVLAAMPFRDEEEAIRFANATDFGLVAGVWTRDGSRQLRMARALKSGQVFINNYGAGGGIEVPFGGVKASGYGREKGFEALHGFSVVKTVVIERG